MDERPPPPPGVLPPVVVPPGQEPTTPGQFPPPASSSPPPKQKSSLGRGATIAVGLVAAAAGYFGVQALLGGGGDPPSAAEVTAAFTPVEGYTYGSIPQAALDQARSTLSSATSKDEVTNLDARSISIGGQPVAAVIIVAIKPGISGGDKDEFLAGFSSTAGASLDEVPIGNVTGYLGTSSVGPTLVFFDEDGFVFVLQGIQSTDPTVITEIAQSLQAAND
jgi:hypothetical protein